jgi:peptide/nickel transport system substrate-binding protein
MKKWICFVLCFFMIIFIVPQSIYGEGQKSTTSLRSNLNPSYSLRLDTFEWMDSCIKKCTESLIFEETDVYDSMDAIERGDFLRWLIQSMDIPLVSSDHNFADVDKNNPNYKYIQTAVEAGIIEKTTHFYPHDFLLRYVASIWLVNATGEEAIQKALSYTQPVIAAQDGYYEVPKEAIGSMTVCYLPAYQLMNYRYITNDGYRRVHPCQPLLFGEAAYSFTMMMNPPKKGGDVSISFLQEPSTLFPSIDWVRTSHDVGAMIGSPSRDADNYWGRYPELLKRIPTQENGLWTIQQDKNGEFQSMEIVYELRENIFWSDGTPITAQDALFAFYFYRHPSCPIVHSEIDFWVNKIVALDEHKVMVQWNTPYFHADSGLGLLPRHYFEEKFQYILEPYDITKPQDETSEKYKADTSFIMNCCKDEEYGENPILAGPYVVEEWNKGYSILLKPNPYYLFDAPVLDEIRIEFFPSPSHIFKDSNESVVDVAPIFYADDDHPATHDIHVTPSTTWEHIDLNVDIEPLNDRKVRQALMLAIDRNRILEEVYQGNEVQLANSWLYPKHMGSQHYSLQDYSYDMDKAKILLDKAGWIMDPVTNYREKDGEVFTITFITTAGNRSRESVQDIITECWENLGINVIVSNQQPTNFFIYTLRERKFDGPSACLYAWIMSPYSNLYSIIHSSQIPDERNGWTGQNYTGFQHDYVDALVEECKTTLDKTTWGKNLNVVQEILMKELPSLPLYFRTDISCLHKDLMNFKPCGNSGSSDFWNIAYWYWK